MEENIASIIKKFNKYRSDYEKFSDTLSYKNFATNSIKFDSVISLLYFENIKKSDRVFVVVPSIFNSPNILNIGRPQDLITKLKSLGKVYLIEWQEVIDPNHKLEDYVKSLNMALKKISSHHNIKINLIGHCLGANFTIASAIIEESILNSLLILSPPWDFSFLYNHKKLYDYFEINNQISKLDHIPALYFQIMFFLMSSHNVFKKIQNYSGNILYTTKENFFEIERWQLSGHDIANATYLELINNVIDQNIMLNNMWVLDNKIINPSFINIPVMMAIGTKDQIVPKESSEVLSKIISQITKFEYNTGHIGYLVGSQKEHFMIDLENWIKMVDKNEKCLYYAC